MIFFEEMIIYCKFKLNKLIERFIRAQDSLF